MAKLTFSILLMFSILSCFRKKTPPDNIEAWLEYQFPGQFQVLISNLKMLDVMAQFKGEKQAVIADKANPEAQFLLDWQKGSESLGLDIETLKEAHKRAKADVAQARELFKLLANAGLKNFSAGVIGHIAYIQVFAEPSPSVRAQTLALLTSTLGARPEQPQTCLFLELMEPEAYHTEFQDIIPRGHWEMGMGWQREQEIMSLDFELGKALDMPALMRHWQINLESKRGSQYKDEAFQRALAWGKQNLPQPFVMTTDEPVSVEILENDSPAIRYGFPYFDKKPTDEAEPTGYVTGVYDLDQKAFLNLRKQKEF